MIGLNHHRVFQPITDRVGREAYNSVFGDLITASRLDDISLQFQYNICDYDTISSVLNGRTITQAESMAVVSSGIAVDGFAELISRENIKYRPGYEGFVWFTAKFTTDVSGKLGIDGSTQRVGIFDDDNGLFIGFENEIFGVTRRVEGVDNFTAISGFNIDVLDGNGKSGYDIDFSKLNIYKISFGWLGSNIINFEVTTPYGKQALFNQIYYSGLNERPHIGDPQNHYSMRVEKVSGSTDVIISTGSVNAGNAKTLQRNKSSRYFAFNFTQVAFNGGPTNIFTIRNKGTFQGKNNKIRIEVLFTAITADVRGTYTVLKNATLGASTYADIDADCSVIEVATDLTSVTDGDLQIAFALVANSADNFSLVGQNISLNPNDTLTFAAVHGNNGISTIGIRWEEEF